MVERYRFWCQDSDAEVSREPNGGWVRHEDYARLQEQLEAQKAYSIEMLHRKDAQFERAEAAISRAEAAEAERDRLRATVTRVTDLLDSYEDRFSPPHTIVEREIGILDTCANIRMAIAGTHDPAALQKEPQP